MFLPLPTKEQTCIVHNIPEIILSKSKVKIISLPGTGKTSLLKEIIYSQPQNKFLYLTFSNKAADEAKDDVPSNCDVFTLHSFCLKFIRKRGRLISSYSVRYIQNHLNISFERAIHVKSLLDTYLKSSHIHLVDCVKNENDKTIEYARVFLADVWKRKAFVSFDYILKEFMLHYAHRDFPLDYDCILVDEVQDSSPVATQIYNNIKDVGCLYVGDPNQAINGYMGARNAIDNLNVNKEYFLTVNFRSTEAVLALANSVLIDILGKKEPIKPSGVPRRDIGGIAIITRTNAELIHYVEFYDSFSLRKEPESLFGLPLALCAWKNSELLDNNYRYLSNIKDVKALEKFSEKTGDRTLWSAYLLAEREGRTRLLSLKNKALQSHSKNAKIELLNCHASKGLQYRKIRIGSDFPSLLDMAKKVDGGEESVEVLVEECRLYFVALTRASEEIIDKTCNKSLSSQEKAFIKNVIQGKRNEQRYNSRRVCV